MALLESINLEHLPPTHTVHVALYQSVTNAEFLHQQLLSGNSDFEYAFIDANVIISRTHALAAVFRAVNDLLEGRLKTRNVHSEIVFCLSPNNNIAESFRRFGITPASTTNLLVIKVSTPSNPHTATSIKEHLSSVIQGEQVPFSDDVLAGITDWPRVRKIYKLGGVAETRGAALSNGTSGSTSVVNGSHGGGVMGVELDPLKSELGVMVLGAMALRGAS